MKIEEANKKEILDYLQFLFESASKKAHEELEYRYSTSEYEYHESFERLWDIIFHGENSISKILKEKFPDFEYNNFDDGYYHEVVDFINSFNLYCNREETGFPSFEDWYKENREVKSLND